VLVLDSASLARAARAALLAELARLVSQGAFQQHTVLGAAWHAAHVLDVLARSEPSVRPWTEYSLVCLNEIPDEELDALSRWTGLLVPRNGPDAGRNAGAASALAAAEARQAIAVLDDLELVTVAAGAGHDVKVLWLPAVLDVFVAGGWAATDAARSLASLRGQPGAHWSDDDLAVLEWARS